MRSLQFGGIYPDDQAQTYHIEELIEITQKLPDRLPQKSICDIQITKPPNFSENKYVKLPKLSFENGALLIVEELTDISEAQKIQVAFNNDEDLLSIAFSVELDEDLHEKVSHRLDYGLRYTVIDMIFANYDGSFQTKIEKNCIVNLLELPLL